MSNKETYFVVEFRAFAFETANQAQIMADKLTDAFCEMPEAKGYGASTRIIEEEE